MRWVHKSKTERLRLDGNKPIDTFADKVKCAECKHWIDKSDSFPVTVNAPFADSVQHYCPMHKKPYDEVWYSSFALPAVYYGRTKMTSDGTPITKPQSTKQKRS